MNRLLAYLVSWGIFLLVFLLAVEGGLYLLGKGPQPTINTFDPHMGWVKTPDTESSRATDEFDITYTINSLGLRDDAALAVKKPEGVTRILVLGDSFTLGYTVDRADLFVDLLEKALVKEGRKVEVINGGTEGYSTDQELVWLRREGLKFDPDFVVMNFYQNDVFWNSQDHYDRYPKPLFEAEGNGDAAVQAELENPGEQSWWASSTAMGSFFSSKGSALPMCTTQSGQAIPAEWGVILKDAPAEIAKAWKHTEAVLKGFKATCDAKGIKPLVALIPTKAQIYDEFRDQQGAQLNIGPDAWDPGLPFMHMKALLGRVGIDCVDPTADFLGEAKKGTALYYTKDRHFSPEGNRAYAQALYNRLVQENYLGAAEGGPAAIALGSGAVTVDEAGGLPTWLFVVLTLWLFLGISYAVNYRDENGFAGFLKVGALIWVVVGLISLINLLIAVLPYGMGGIIIGVLILAILIFLLWKMKDRIGLIMELYMAFTHRGHWYMMPLLAVMLAIGSLLIVAASSPFVAPFIYTLF